MAAIVATGVDLSYSGSTMDYGAVRRAGYSIVGRYLGNDTRCLTVAERDRIYGAGLRLFVIGQIGAVTRPRGGYKQGLLDGEFFVNEALEMGWPKGKPIICAIADVGDGFPSMQDMPQIREYARGERERINAAGYPYGIYGPYWVLEEFRNDPTIFCSWQTAGASGSGQGTGGQAFNAGDNSWRRLSSLACMYQEYGSVSVPGTDHNQVFESSFGRFTYHPNDGEDPQQSEENLDMKAVFCPDQTGGTGWRTYSDGGKKFREGYTSREDLDVDLLTGLVDGEITLHGAQGERFLARYPERGYEGPRLFSLTGDADPEHWSREVAGLDQGETARFYMVPDRYIIGVRKDGQFNADRYVGIPEMPVVEQFLWNQPLVGYNNGLSLDVDESQISVLSAVSDDDKNDIAKRTSDTLFRRLQD